MGAPTTAAAVANAFLDLQAEDRSSFPRIDSLKLQKLLYFSQGWWLAESPDPLFEDDIVAWTWGPVVKSIYYQFKKFGREPIEGARAIELVKVGNGPLDYRIVTPPVPNKDVMDFLREVWTTHKSLSGIQLSNSTHAAGEPWSIVKEQYGDLSAEPIIPIALIRDVFSTKMAA